MTIPVLLAVSGLHNYLVRQGKGTMASIVVDTAEACEIHHFACLVGYGAAAIHLTAPSQRYVNGAWRIIWKITVTLRPKESSRS